MRSFVAFQQQPAPVSDCDVAVIGGGLVGSMAALMLRKRGLRVAVLETRARGQQRKVVVGEALTEGTSVFLHHELGLGDWLGEHAFRKYGFDFLTQPRSGEQPRDLDDCHELLLSLTPLERIRGAFGRLIPTYHVDRPRFDAEIARRAEAAGASYLWSSSVREVELGDRSAGVDHCVHYQRDGVAGELRCKWVLDASGRRRVLGRQLGITRPMAGLETAAIWNRFTKVRGEPEFWQTFRGIDRRRHTIHFTGPGFWFWWIHIDDETTSVGVSFDKRQHEVDSKRDDRGFGQLLAQFPALERALAGAEPVERYSYYANLPYESDHWLDNRGYALVGDASTFVDALYSIGIEMACRQLVAVAPVITAACADAPDGAASWGATTERLNRDHALTQESVRLLNKFKYEHAWHQPRVLMQTALYDLAEIAELYHLQEARHWTPRNLERHYRLQWSSEARRDALVSFMNEARNDAEGGRPGAAPMAKALAPGRLIYGVTRPRWHLPKARPYIFKMTRTWGYMERLSQRLALWPDFLSRMAGPRRPRLAAPVREPVAAAQDRVASGGVQ